MHLIVGPDTFVDAAIGPDLPTLSFNPVFDKLSFIFVSICPCEDAMPMLGSIDVAADEFTAIRPALHTSPVLQVILPEAAVLRSMLVVDKPYSIRLIILPLSLIHFAIFVDEAAVVVWLIIFPVALEHATVWVYLETATVSRVAIFAPFSYID